MPVQRYGLSKFKSPLRRGSHAQLKIENPPSSFLFSSSVGVFDYPYSTPLLLKPKFRNSSCTQVLAYIPGKAVSIHYLMYYSSITYPLPRSSNLHIKFDPQSTLHCPCNVHKFRKHESINTT